MKQCSISAAHTADDVKMTLAATERTLASLLTPSHTGG
jgi:hypothetical protein